MTLQVGPFELQEPLPPLKEPRLLMALRPWIDVGSVATLALTFLEDAWSAQTIAQLARPGRFYDFTRYRPLLYRSEGKRHVSVPNTVLKAARDAEGQDWLLLHALEPHLNGEEYVEGVLELLKRLGVSWYAMIGSMYAPVPHSRPAIPSGGATSDRLRERLRRIGVKESNYEGPTTILATLSGLAEEAGIDSMTLILQLPAYMQLERDYRGLQGLLIYLCVLLERDLDLAPIRQQVGEQMFAVEQSVEEDERLKAWVQELEAAWDAEHRPGGKEEEEAAPLSPELESFLRDLERRWAEGEPS